MAACYIEEMRTVQPKGPYCIGGLCFGGIVAFEMAQQLVAQGETVALLALIDSPATNAPEHLTLSLRVLNVLADLPRWLTGLMQLTRDQWLDLIRLKAALARAKMTVRIRSLRAGPGGDGASGGVSERIQRLGDHFHFSEHHRTVAEAQRHAQRSYTPSVYPGHIVLFRARMQPFFGSHLPDKGWAQLAAGGLEVTVVPGNHLGMLQEPHVRVLAAELGARLDRAHGSNAAAHLLDSTA